MAGTSPAMTTEIMLESLEELLFLLRLFRHPLEAVLHVLHLTAKIVDVVLDGCGLQRLFRFERDRTAARRHERLEHRERLLKQFHVAADMFLERRERRSAKSVGELLA